MPRAYSTGTSVTTDAAPGAEAPRSEEAGGGRGSGGRSLRTAAAPQRPGPPAARRARPDPCHGPPRSPSRRRPRPPHPSGREGPGGAGRTAAAGRGSRAWRAGLAAGKGRWICRGPGLTGLPPLPDTAVRGRQARLKTAPPRAKVPDAAAGEGGRALKGGPLGVCPARRSGEAGGGLWLLHSRAVCFPSHPSDGRARPQCLAPMPRGTPRAAWARLRGLARRVRAGECGEAQPRMEACGGTRVFRTA